MSAEDRRKWDARHAERGLPGEPSAAVLRLERFFPRHGRALDVAGGAGRHALWMAARGLDVTLIDVSPVALDIARAHAGALPLTTVTLDLDEASLPAGPWDVVLFAHFLDRRVYAAVPEILPPGGTWVVVHPTIANLERHPSPAAPFLLEPGELPRFAAGLEILLSDEGWTPYEGHEARHEARHEAVLVARRPA